MTVLSSLGSFVVVVGLLTLTPGMDTALILRTAAVGAPRRAWGVVAGCKSNQGEFYPSFDHVVLLSAPVEVLLARIAARTDNPYGKSPEERAAVLDHLAHVEPLLRATATAEMDATAPVDEVVRQLEALLGT